MTPPAWLGYGWLEPQFIGWMLQGAALTAWLALLVCVLATLLGVLLAAGHEQRWRSVRLTVRTFLSLHRNTPLMVQLLLWYFGVAGLLPEAAMLWLNAPHEVSLAGWTLAWPSFEFVAALVALSLYSAAFVAEEIRAGIRSVAAGQRAAALALGMTPRQVFRHIVLPQALRVVHRPLLGQYLGVIKNTSLTMAIGVAELSYSSRQVESETLLTFQAFAVATLLYLMLVLGAQLAGGRVRPTLGEGR
ncbi:amino acid ABC transporter permease [Vogesella indigofera]|uniref:amino acid ABC transporter permease n=1 Tax=Vogesella indigofera TaxID=45465 RepID=UPI00234EBBC7|nr:amino acid ABC transporter permease [Vogesella indigofera]MDC7707682.1 amino acid ABC transporter permease [Vogesella indigofera]